MEQVIALLGEKLEEVLPMVGENLDGLVSLVVWILVLSVFGRVLRKKAGQTAAKSGTADSSKREASSMPHAHKSAGVYNTYNRKNARNDAGAMPHRHDKGHYTSMSDASRLPKGYILLNGEPVRVADLDGK
ncbi:hypothetical protein SAMN04487770_10738 [Butyrivibrio sp. ob235]|uniref:hypothetical protein n=1 Tax=Butyrivibrio sp. ob235 TaxID=1761780 RepID=UPI0008BBF0A4|nr:hypothetical protein [Butyrivibrio sp. ob235]SEL19867.1 hypothetical protein SAMN04487770_10738 [Butyrivibrio sp. ob235]